MADRVFVQISQSRQNNSVKHSEVASLLFYFIFVYKTACLVWVEPASSVESKGTWGKLMDAKSGIRWKVANAKSFNSSAPVFCNRLK